MNVASAFARPGSWAQPRGASLARPVSDAQLESVSPGLGTLLEQDRQLSGQLGRVQSSLGRTAPLLIGAVLAEMALGVAFFAIGSPLTAHGFQLAAVKGVALGMGLGLPTLLGAVALKKKWLNREVQLFTQVAELRENVQHQRRCAQEVLALTPPPATTGLTETSTQVTLSGVSLKKRQSEISFP